MKKQSMKDRKDESKAMKKEEMKKKMDRKDESEGMKKAMRKKK